MSKRCVEMVLSLVLLILLAPFILLTGVAIRLGSAGSAIFKQSRVGYGGKLFTLYKFRTMYAHVDPQGISPAGSNDLRVTGIGGFLRKYKLDEIPQFYNVLKGEMSFVGPRPQLQAELEEFRESHGELLDKRQTVLPGLTCHWAISPGVVKIKPTPEMLAKDCEYVDQASWRTDLKILYNTLIYLWGRRKIS